MNTSSETMTAPNERAASKHAELADENPDTEGFPIRAIAAYLEDLTRKIVKELHSPNRDTSPLLLKHEHEDFVLASRTNDCPLLHAVGRQAHFDLTEMHMQRDPTFTMEPHNITAKVHRGSQSAEVYFIIIETATQEHQVLKRETMNITHWEKQENGVWQVCRHHAIRYGGLYGWQVPHGTG